MSNFDKLFGRTYSTVGNSDSDFIIKTRGQVKVQWGKKFIDIIKDGKLNVDAEVIKKVSSPDRISSDGIYYVESTNEVMLKIGNTVINLSDDGSGTFVSFLSKQDTTEEQKAVACSNIGFRYETEEAATLAGVRNGVVFIDETERFFIVNDGIFTKYPSEISMPYTGQFVIQKSDSSVGAIIINGEGIGNALVLGTTSNGASLYRENGATYVKNSAGNIILRIGNSNVVVAGTSETIFSTDITTSGSVISDSISSNSFSDNYGFKLYIENGKSKLVVDSVIERSPSDNSVEVTFSELLELINNEDLIVGAKYVIKDFQNEWELTTEDDTQEPSNEDDTKDDEELTDESESTPDPPVNTRPLVVTATTTSTLNPIAYYKDFPSWEIEYDVNYQEVFQLPGIDEDGASVMEDVMAKGRITKLTDEKGNSCNYDFKHLKFKITEDGVDKWIYTFRNGEEDLSLTDTCRNNALTVNNYEIKSETVTVRDNGNIVTLQGTLSDNNFGTINGNFNFSGTANKLNVSGTLENVTFKEDSTIDEVTIRSLTNVTFNESFSRTTFHSDINDVDFDTTVYALLYDNEKVKDVYYNNNTVSVICIPDMSTATSGIPAGTIVMYNGTSGIPAGWAICDGTEGTPNLTGNFIKASETAGETGEFIPASSGSSTETPITYYSLVFIMKLA